jgi:ABC-type amino acid transport substrate-binding protein
MNIVNSIFIIFFIAAIGVGNASTVMLGKQLGAGEKEKTYKNAILFLKVGIVLGIISGLLLVACIPVMLQLYKDFDAQTLSLMAQVLVGEGTDFANLTFVDVGFADEDFGVAFRKSDEGLAKAFDLFVKLTKMNGEFAKLQAKYFG